jgi:hypothetical protein
MQQAACPAASAEGLGERVGLINVGAGFYRTPEAFAEEARTMGISRRVSAVPRGFKLGETWVFLAHPKLQMIDGEWKGGIFAMFKPTAIERLFTASGYAATDEEERRRMERQNVTPIIVPDDDRDHQGTVYDREDEPELELA